MVSESSFREAMSRLGAAVNVVTSDGPSGRAGFTATAVCSVSDSPPTLLVCVHSLSQAGVVLRRNGVACINVLRAADDGVADLFAGRCGVFGEERFRSGDWQRLATGAPVLRSALVALDCRIFDSREVGSHTVCMARVEAIHEGAPDAALMYFRRRYRVLAADA